MKIHTNTPQTSTPKPSPHTRTRTLIRGYSCPKQASVKPLGRFSHTSNIKDSLQLYSVTLSLSPKLHESCCLVTEAVCVLHGNISRLVIITKDLISVLLISARGGVIGFSLVSCTLIGVCYTFFQGFSFIQLPKNSYNTRK